MLEDKSKLNPEDMETDENEKMDLFEQIEDLGITLEDSVIIKDLLS